MDIRPGDYVFVIAKVVEVTDASQSVDVTVALPNGTTAALTDLDLARNNGEVIGCRFDTNESQQEMDAEDRTWTTVTLKPPLVTNAGETYQQMMSACGRVLIVVGPDSAMVYRRTGDNFELASEVRLIFGNDGVSDYYGRRGP